MAILCSPLQVYGRLLPNTHEQAATMTDDSIHKEGMMTYGNWDAFVFKNGERMSRWEDNTPYQENDLISGYWQAFGKSETGTNRHHAILGDKRVRLCGYKHYPSLYIDGKEIDLKPYVTEGLEEYQYEGNPGWVVNSFAGAIEGEIEGYRFKAHLWDGNMLDLELIEPDGTHWQSRCGYCCHQTHPVVK
jgi:hypothetical protein